MNSCIKTGADVWLTSHHCMVHGDMYRCGLMYVFRYCEDVRYDVRQACAHFVFDDDLAMVAAAEMPNRPPPFIDLQGARVMVINTLYVKDQRESQTV